MMLELNQHTEVTQGQGHLWGWFAAARPRWGSPAKSYSRRNSIRVMMSPFSFHGIASAA